MIDLRALASAGVAFVAIVATAAFSPSLPRVTVTPIAASASAASSNWKTQPIPNPPSESATMNALSCLSASSCIAVGTNDPSAVVAEQWNGTKWTPLVAPVPAGSYYEYSLNSVSCTSSSFCIAAGDYVGLVGYDKYQLLEEWNGHVWTIMSTPTIRGARSTYLSGVSCVSGRFCVAVGYFETKASQDTLSEFWNGTSWRVVPSPNPKRGGQLSGVACPSTKSCESVGQSGIVSPLAEAWSGTKWAITPTPTSARSGSGVLNAVSCVAPRECTGVGYAEPVTRTLIYELTGTKWRSVPSPSPAGRDAYLNSVSCMSSVSCVTVGYYFVYTNTRTLAESWNGVKWKIESSVSPSAYGTNSLNGVSCPKRGPCRSVGVYVQASIYHVLAEFRRPA